MNKREKIELVKKVLFEMYPGAVTELQYETEFQLLVAIIMSAQTTDKQVNKVNTLFFKKLKTPEDAILLWEEKIKSYIKSVSFFNNKAKNIFGTAKLLVENYNSHIPNTLETLMTLPWVGVKTAKVFLSIVYNAPYLAVDTHVHRVLNRLWLVNTKTPLETDKAVEKIFTQNDNAFLHHTLILFWRYHCTARNPKCSICHLKWVCKYYKKNILWK